MEELELYDRKKWDPLREFLNSPAQEERYDIFRKLALEAMFEFDNVADYIWKLPNLVEYEHAVELQKLRDYFPLTGDPKGDEQTKRLRRHRWQTNLTSFLNCFRA